MTDANKSQEEPAAAPPSAPASQAPSLDNISRNLRERLAGLKMTPRGDDDRKSAANMGREVNMTEFLDVWMYCYSPPNQVSSYYREGLVDPCVDAMEDMWTCLKLRMDYTAEEKREMMERLHRSKNKNNPSSAVWSFREESEAAWAPVLARAGVTPPSSSTAILQQGTEADSSS
jgi:hypothetical protein